MSTILEARDISKSFTSGNVKVDAIKDVNLDIKAGTINVIIGRSGSGKSTLLKILGGLLKPDNGQVLVQEDAIYSLSEPDRTRLRSRKLGFVFQEYNLINELSIINNVRLPYDINNLQYDTRAEEEIFDMLGLHERLHFYPDQLSGGERQRTAIARALIMKPLLILADEPTGNLDSDSAKNVMSFFATSNRLLNQTFVVVTHDIEWLKIAHNVYRMSDGNLSVEK